MQSGAATRDVARSLTAVGVSVYTTVDKVVS
jgi:hypothetical protein